MKQICSSDFLSSVWLDGFFKLQLNNHSETIQFSTDDFRHRGKYFFYTILYMCVFAQQTIQVNKNLQLNGQFISGSAMPRKYNDI